MKKAEEEALKAFPPRMEFPSMVSAAIGNKVDTNEKSRNIFIKGYEQAMKDLLDNRDVYRVDENSDDSLRQAVVDEVVKYSGENYWKAPWVVDSTGIAHPLHFAQLGADWQRNHVWHDPDEEPDIDCKIMWEGENHLGKNLSAGQWKAHKDVFGRKERWCYVSDILPTKKR